VRWELVKGGDALTGGGGWFGLIGEGVRGRIGGLLIQHLTIDEAHYDFIRRVRTRATTNRGCRVFKQV